MESNNILFLLPDERVVYEKAVVRADAVHLPSLAFALLGAVARQHGYRCRVLDLSLEVNPRRALEDCLRELEPRYLGLTCTTATIGQATELAAIAKGIRPSTQVLIGGPHVTHLPAVTLKSPAIDFVFMGEAERSFAAFLSGAPRDSITGLAYRKGDGELQLTPPAYIEDLDEIPFPDFSLYDLSRYSISQFYVERNPVVWFETSRGCIHRCKYCAKGVPGNRFRAKSPRRVLDEMEHILRTGVKELFFADNGFTTDLERAEAICDGIIDRRLAFRWHCLNGIRADKTNERLFRKMKRAGCVRIALGIESGNEAILRKNGKRISLRATEEAVRLAKKEGIEVWGYFLLGFPEETEQTMAETIELACRLPLDIIKVNIIVPFPDTILYQEYEKRNLFLPDIDFSHFNSNFPPREVYRHPTLDWSVIEKYQRRFYRRFYLSPSFIARRLRYSWSRGLLLSDLKTFLQNLSIRIPGMDLLRNR